MAKVPVLCWTWPLSSDERQQFYALVAKHRLPEEAVFDLEQLIDEFAVEAHGRGADSVECEDY